jgi:hypothetical protein
MGLLNKLLKIIDFMYEILQVLGRANVEIPLGKMNIFLAVMVLVHCSSLVVPAGNDGWRGGRLRLLGAGAFQAVQALRAQVSSLIEDICMCSPIRLYTLHKTRNKNYT